MREVFVMIYGNINNPRFPLLYMDYGVILSPLKKGVRGVDFCLGTKIPLASSPPFQRGRFKGFLMEKWVNYQTSCWYL